MSKGKARGRKGKQKRTSDPCVSFIVVSWNACDLTLACLRSIFENVQSVSFEVLLVDNASTDGTAEIVGREFPEATVIVNEEHRGFAEANNGAIQRARGEYLVLLNNALCQTGWAGDALGPESWRDVLRTRLQELDWGRAVSDVRPFLEPGADLELLTLDNLLSLL